MGMPLRKPQEFEIGKYLCPKTKSPVPLMAPCSLAFVEWPVVVAQCAACGERHVLECEDVEHSPVFGYE